MFAPLVTHKKPLFIITVSVHFKLHKVKVLERRDYHKFLTAPTTAIKKHIEKVLIHKSGSKTMTFVRK